MNTSDAHQTALNLPGDPKDAKAQDARAAERAVYLERLRQHLQDPAFRAIEGFPLGDDEAILALSDPPYYTACPNPFLPEIVEGWQAERAALRSKLGLPDDAEENGANGNGAYHREPYAADVSEGKNHPIYNAHSYHTKVPHKAIMRYILHYTDPGDIVYDGFCGTGMTGVAAQLCGDKRAVEELGYRVDSQGAIWEGGVKIGLLGARKAVLNDLSPAATFIAYNYNTPVDVDAFQREARRILREVERECGWMYETWHPHCDDPQRSKCRINYTVWSDVFICPACGEEIIFWEAAVDQDAGQVLDAFPCPGCSAEQTKRSLTRAMETVYDRALGQTIERARQVPVLINYSVGKSRREKAPDADDLALIRRIEECDIPYPFPTDRMPEGYNTEQPKVSHGITHVHHFWLARTAKVMSAYRYLATCVHDRRLSSQLVQVLTSVAEGSSRLNRERIFGLPSKLSGTLYVSSMMREIDTIAFLKRKAERFSSLQQSLVSNRSLALVDTRSSTNNKLGGVDYIFTDPPFGGNLMYSELNYLWEAWLEVFTDNDPEAIVNDVQRKRLAEYQRLMERCFAQFYRALKPGRWITVEFHNSRNSIWTAIQEAILRAGFVVADVRVLDKKQKTIKQITGADAVSQDLIISAYRPRSGFVQRFALEAGSPEGAWAFVRQHLAQVPRVVRADGALEPVAERQPFLLYDRMVAFHIQRGATVPLSAVEFYAGLKERFTARDGMVFLPDQVAEYDRARLEIGAVQQLTLFVNDEKSTLRWLRQQLDPEVGGAPSTYSDLQPGFLRELHKSRHEALPELRAMLEENFVQDEEGRWRVPDPKDAGDLEALRTRALLREFQGYAEGRGRLREVRTEAVRAGFSHCWRERAYGAIVAVAERLPRNVLEEDADLLMYLDNASLMVE